jgi:hypothetical protein
MTNLDEHQVIWVGADATTYTAPCELCQEDRRWADVIIDRTVVEGTLRREADVGFTTCCRGHRIRVRRISRRLRAVATG